MDSDQPETAYLPAIRALPLSLYKSVEGLPRNKQNFSEIKDMSYHQKNLRDSLNIKTALRLTKTKNDSLSPQ